MNIPIIDIYEDGRIEGCEDVADALAVTPGAFSVASRILGLCNNVSQSVSPSASAEDGSSSVSESSTAAPSAKPRRKARTPKPQQSPPPLRLKNTKGSRVRST